MRSDEACGHDEDVDGNVTGQKKLYDHFISLNSPFLCWGGNIIDLRNQGYFLKSVFFVVGVKLVNTSDFDQNNLLYIKVFLFWFIVAS